MKLDLTSNSSQNQLVDLSDFGSFSAELTLKREDLLHPLISGNKYRKLKYNLRKAVSDGCKTLLTFGGAYSNHILATAAAANENNLKSIGIIRGEELNRNSNPTLRQAASLGMKLHFVARDHYRKKDHPEFLADLVGSTKGVYLLPEGGTNELAVKGCEEILQPCDEEFDYVCCSAGTGGTVAGILRSVDKQQVIGFSALKGDFLRPVISEYAGTNEFYLTDKYTFGGYGKIDTVLLRFINNFHRKTGIPLDPVYTGKMLFGIIDLMKKGYFKKNSRILAIHTGGLQGIQGMNERLAAKGQPQIDYRHA